MKENILRRPFTKEEIEEVKRQPITPEDRLEAIKAFTIPNRRLNSCFGESPQHPQVNVVGAFVLAYRLFMLREAESKKADI